MRNWVIMKDGKFANSAAHTTIWVHDIRDAWVWDDQDLQLSQLDQHLLDAQSPGEKLVEVDVVRIVTLK